MLQMPTTIFASAFSGFAAGWSRLGPRAIGRRRALSACAGWCPWALIFPIASAGLASSLYVLREPVAAAQAQMIQEIEAEDDFVCLKLGFSPSNTKYATCQEALLQLRYNDRKLVSAGAAL